MRTTSGIGAAPRPVAAEPLARAIVENGSPVLRIAHARHGSGRREIGGGMDVPIMVALSAGHHVERRTPAGACRQPASVGAVTVVDPAERTVFTVDGQARVLQIFVSLRLIEEVVETKVGPVRSLFNEHDAGLERSAMGALGALHGGDSQSDLLLYSVALRLAEILGQPSGRAESSWQGGVTGAALRRLDALVQARLDEPTPSSPSLIELAQAAGLSKHHFIKAFRATVGETPYAWVMRRRIERARTLLTLPDQTVGAVAFQTGFGSSAHFVASFRQRLGITPGLFRHSVLS